MIDKPADVWRRARKHKLKEPTMEEPKMDEVKKQKKKVDKLVKKINKKASENVMIVNLMGEAIRCIRWFNFKMASEMARELEISSPYLCYMEKGTKVVTEDVVKRIAYLFSFKVTDIQSFAASLNPDDTASVKVKKYIKHCIKGGK